MRVYFICAAVLSFPVGCLADDNTLTNPREFAATRVFRVETDVNNGSAVVIEFDGTKAIFATCFHILSDCRSFKLKNIDSTTIAKSDDAEILRRWNRDLVFIRVPITDTTLVARGGFNPDGVPYVVGRNELPNGFALGYADGHDLHDVKCRFINRTLNVKGLPSFEEQKFTLQGDDIDTSQFKVRELSDAITFKGMSGGLVVDGQRRFGGLIFGQLSTGQSLTIPAEDVGETMKQIAEQKAKQFVPFNRSLFRAPPPFTGSVLADLGVLPLRCDANLGQVSELVAGEKYAELSKLLKDTRVKWDGVVVVADEPYVFKYIVRPGQDKKESLRVRLLLDSSAKFKKMGVGDPISFEGEILSFPKAKGEITIVVAKCKLIERAAGRPEPVRP